MNDILILMISGLYFFTSLIGYEIPRSEPDSNGCDRMGWYPEEFGLKDHSVFWYDGYYYLVSIYLPDEKKFAYARSKDLCNWEDLGPILDIRVPGSWEELAIWAPYVWQENGNYYLIYTGVSRGITQSIMLATSTDPSNPESWQSHGMVFQPSHSGMVWEAGKWADCRDPTVIKIENTYYLYYTGLDIDGGIIGMATSLSPFGPWVDWGGIISPLPANVMAESATVVSFDQSYYLFYNDTSRGGMYRIGGSQAGPWEPPVGFTPGWAHELWQNSSGQWYTSYLQDYTVTISPMTWDNFFSPAKPSIGLSVYHMVLPMVLQQETGPVK
jgi:hypothetical protein